MSKGRMPKGGMPKGYGLPDGVGSPPCKEVQGQSPSNGLIRSRGLDRGHQHLADHPSNGLSKLTVSWLIAFCLLSTDYT